MSYKAFKKISDERIEELETCAWMAFDTILQPVVVSNLQIFVEGMGYFNPETNTYLEKPLDDKEIVEYDNKSIFIRTYILSKVEPLDFCLYFFDVSFYEKKLKWTLRNLININHKPINSVKKRNITQHSYNFLADDVNAGRLKQVEIQDMFKHEEINFIKKAPVTIDACDFVKESTKNSKIWDSYMSLLIESYEVDKDYNYEGKKPELKTDSLMVEDFFKSERESLDVDLLLNIFYLMKDDWEYNKHGMFCPQKGNNYKALYSFLDSKGLNNVLFEILRDYCQIKTSQGKNSWINAEATTSIDFFGLPRKILIHAAHRNCLDSLSNIKLLRDIWGLNNGVDGFYELFELIDSSINSDNEIFQAGELLADILESIKKGCTLRKAIDSISS